MTFHNGRFSRWHTGILRLNEYGVRVAFYVTPAAVRQDRRAWVDAVAARHEIGNFSVHHPWTGSFPWNRNHAL